MESCKKVTLDRNPHMTLYQRPQVLHSCLVLLVTLWSNKFEKKSLYLSYTFWSYSITKGRQGRNWGQWSRDRNWRRLWMNISSLLTSQGYLAYFLIHSMITCPSAALATVSWVLLNQFLIKQMFTDMSIVNVIEIASQFTFPLFSWFYLVLTKQSNRINQSNTQTKVIQPLHPFLWLYYQALFSPDLDILHAWGTYKQIRYSCTNFYDFIIYGFCLCKYLLDNKDQ